MSESKKQTVGLPGANFQIEVETVNNEVAFHFKSNDGENLCSIYAYQHSISTWWSNNQPTEKPLNGFCIGARVHSDKTLITSNGLLSAMVRKSDGFR